MYKSIMQFFAHQRVEIKADNVTFVKEVYNRCFIKTS
jgi:hypothetical protein